MTNGAAALSNGWLYNSRQTPMISGKRCRCIGSR